MNVRLVAFLSLLVCLLPFTVNAQMPSRRTTKPSGPVDITARELRYNKEQNIYTAEGDVEMKQGTKKLTADFVLYNQTTEDAFAEGHVTFQDQSDTIYAERMSFNLATQRGTIENGRVFTRLGSFYMTGDEIEKTGESSYMVHSGKFTTCGWDKPTWVFYAKEVEMNMGEYATARSATFSLLGQKVLYLPWGAFPVKTERQSGFLIPQAQSSSRDGPIFRSAYYWAISKDKDATFFLDWIGERGVKPGAEYRYAASETTKGAWYASFIHDNKYDGDRYQIKGGHQQVFGDDWAFKTNINRVSDNLFLQDLGRTTLERTESSLRSVAFVEKPLEKSLLSFDAEYFQTLLQRSNNSTFQYLPSGSYFTQYLPMFKNRVFGDVSADLTNFWRPQGDKASRFVATPSVHVPYSWQGLNFLTSASLIEKAYSVAPTSPDANQMLHHEAVSLQADANMKFMKDTSTDMFKIGQMQSIIMPRLQYNYFQNTASPYRLPTLDLRDQTLNSNTITYSFNHYLNAVKDDNVRELSLLEIGQTFGLVQNLPGNPFLYQGEGDRFSQIHTRLTLYPTKDLWYVHDEYLDVSGKGLQNMVNSIHYAVPPKFQVDISHSYAPGLAGAAGVDQFWMATITRWRYIDLAYQIRYDLIERRWLDTLASITYHPKCWSITFSVIETRIPRDTSFHLSFNLQGITQKIGAY